MKYHIEQYTNNQAVVTERHLFTGRKQVFQGPIGQCTKWVAKRQHLAVDAPIRAKIIIH